jgi:ubiquinol-cytochrome c reductase cytochrome c subunit
LARLRSAGGLMAIGAVAAFLFVGWTAGDPVPRRAPPAQRADPQVIEAGRALYVANCASCHGLDAGGTTLGPTLEGAGAAAADFYLRTGRMPAGGPGQRIVRHDPKFGEADIQALVAYVASLGLGPEIPQVAAGGDLHRGRELYTANCAACHAVTGAGNAIGGGYVAVGLGFADRTQVAEAVIIGPGAMPRFGFDDRDQADLAAYIDWLRDEPTPGGAPIGGTGPVAEGFIAVAIGVPLLILAAMFVARHGRQEPPRPVRPTADAREVEGA